MASLPFGASPPTSVPGGGLAFAPRARPSSAVRTASRSCATTTARCSKCERVVASDAAMCERELGARGEVRVEPLRLPAERALRLRRDHDGERRRVGARALGLGRRRAFGRRRFLDDDVRVRAREAER
ncbi:hypothetical protein BE20_14715 [Sorangium cellulosum]|nr:hypothetical protein BE20_14715 [Sorangium cellulosum]